MYYEFIEAQVAKRRSEEEQLEKLGSDGDEKPKDILHHIFKQKDEHGNSAYSPDELMGEANLLIIAGTLCITLQVITDLVE